MDFKSKDTKWLNGFKKPRPVYMLPTRDSLQIWRNTQTESEGMEKVILCKQKSKESQSNNTQTKQTLKTITRNKDHIRESAPE